MDESFSARLPKLHVVYEGGCDPTTARAFLSYDDRHQHAAVIDHFHGQWCRVVLLVQRFGLSPFSTICLENSHGFSLSFHGNTDPNSSFNCPSCLSNRSYGRLQPPGVYLENEWESSQFLYELGPPIGRTSRSYPAVGEASPWPRRSTSAQRYPIGRSTRPTNNSRKNKSEESENIGVESKSSIAKIKHNCS